MSEINNSSGRNRTEDERPRRRRTKRRSPAKTVLKVLGTLLLIGLTTGALLACFAAVYIQTVIMPQATLDLGQYNAGVNSTLYYTDDNGQAHELRTLHGDENRVWMEYEDIPQDLINATVAIEDQRFWTHHGVDWWRTAAAVFYMFTGQDIQGGSTITQQMIKNVTGYNETTVKRKVLEIFRALYVDETYGKETTLEWYLNYIFLGRGCYGIYTASYMYFGKPVSELTVAECASLISITNNPSLYDPYINPENNEYRKNLVLQCMLEQGYLSQEEYDEARAQELVFTSSQVETDESDSDSSEVYSWYEEQVITDVTADLVDALGISELVAYNMVLSGGLSIYTCVDPELQAIAESVYENTDNFNYPSSSGQQLQSAITVIDNETGDIVAMVGRVGEKTGNRWRNNATAAYRQPGSAFKPLSVYAPALDLGLITPISIIDDYPYMLSGGSPYPVNSGNARYRGLTTVSRALTNSVNTVAYRVLVDLVTPEASFNFVQDKFKIDLVESKQIGDTTYSDMDGAPLSMGGLTDGVTTRDMAAAFAVFPNMGTYQTPRTYTRVLDQDGNVILENSSSSEVVLKESTAYYMNTMLQNVVTSGTGGEARFSGMHIAGKTGSTTSDYDRWFAGYTPYYTAVVWTGYETPERVRSSGSNPAAVTWRRVMSQIHEGLADQNFSSINNLVSVEYCLDSGLIATDACRSDPRGNRVASMTLLRDDAPTGFCTVHSEASTVTVCTECPILDADGNETGLYHLAGEFCPEESLATVSLLDYTRERVGSASASDDIYLLSYTQEQGTCTVHTSENVDNPDDPGGLIDPDDPNWPGNPENPTDPDVPVDPTDPTDPSDPDPGTDPGGGTGTDPGGSSSSSGGTPSTTG